MPTNSERNDLHALARELSRPVSLNWLPAAHAYAALAIAADKAARRSSPYSLEALARAWRELEQSIISRRENRDAG